MLRINGKNIGDSVEVTVVRKRNGLQVEGRINGRRAFLPKHCRAARAGDRCRATIVGESADRQTYLMKVDQVIVRGDGRKSLVEKVRALLKERKRKGVYRYDQFSIMEALSLVSIHFMRDKAGLLECFLDVLESYSIDGSRTARNPGYTEIGMVAARMIKNAAKERPEQAADAFARLMRYSKETSASKELTDFLRAYPPVDRRRGTTA